MNTSQRLQKRQKRKVARAKENVKISEPDVRTPEQIKAAQEASRATSSANAGPSAQFGMPSQPNRSNASRSPAKADT